MRIINLINVLAVFVMSAGCISLSNLPEPAAVGLYEKGSQIRVTVKNSNDVSGELIAIESGDILILQEGHVGLLSVRQDQVKRFKVHTAKTRHYGWTIPAGMVITLVHGFYSILTMPLSLFVTIPVTLSGENAFTFNQNNTTFEQLKMYARFPQGIPSEIDRGLIH